MDDDRIDRIARALCRSARIDPDKPVIDHAGVPMPMSRDAVAETAAAWMHFRHAAEAFVATHSKPVATPL